MTDDVEQEERKQKRWVIPAVTTLIGILVSILVAWYQINLSEEQALEAEKERAKSVRNELVQIVEEHVINQKPLDVSRLARLSEFKAKQENLLVIPTVSEIVENAEFNILKSQYLEFEKKQQFKEIFNGIYAELTIPSNIKYSGIFENTVNDIYASIQTGNSKEVPAKINKLVTDFNAKIAELEAKNSLRDKTNINDIFKVLFDKPEVMAIALTTYAFILYALMSFRKRARRRRKLEEEIRRRTYEEYMRERDEVMQEIHRKHRENDKE